MVTRVHCVVVVMVVVAACMDAMEFINSITPPSSLRFNPAKPTRRPYIIPHYHCFGECHGDMILPERYHISPTIHIRRGLLHDVVGLFGGSASGDEPWACGCTHLWFAQRGAHQRAQQYGAVCIVLCPACTYTCAGCRFNKSI